MRWIPTIVLLIVLAGWMVYHLDDSPIANTPFVASMWRHTVDGWEKVSDLSRAHFSESAAVDLWSVHPHPIIVSLLVAIVSLMALVAFAPTKSRGKSPRVRLKTTIAQPGELKLQTRTWLDEKVLAEIARGEPAGEV